MLNSKESGNLPERGLRCTSPTKYPQANTGEYRRMAPGWLAVLSSGARARALMYAAKPAGHAARATAPTAHRGPPRAHPGRPPCLAPEHEWRKLAP
eukprot:scaffold751_cov395-Prasinococcus_capsulatus_cf.AAC.13